MDDTFSLQFTSEELHFLDWAMTFLEGGPLDAGQERKRGETLAKVRTVLADYRDGIVHRPASRSSLIRCAFCEGQGVYPDLLGHGEVETEPCPVCKGMGYNAVKDTQTLRLRCRYCDGTGRAWDSSGYSTGEVCQVCSGRCFLLFDDTTETAETVRLWELVHPSIAKVAVTRFRAGHYADAVEAALKEVNREVKRIYHSTTGKECDGADLMQRAFSPRQPVIRLSDLSTESGMNIQQGFMQIFAGAMTGIRNPGAHDNLEIDQARAMHLLVMASLLMQTLDGRP